MILELIKYHNHSPVSFPSFSHSLCGRPASKMAPSDLCPLGYVQFPPTVNRADLSADLREHFKKDRL